MESTVDPNEVRITGENSFMRLSHEDGGPVTTQASHWRALLSPAGPGHVLFLQSELTDDEVRIYSDNIALARWFQEEIERNGDFPDQSLPVIEAEFSRRGDVRSFSTEEIISTDDEISLTWYDLGEPFVVRFPPGFLPDRPHGVYSVLIPARRAQVVLNGSIASGRPFPDEREGHVGSTCCLAWSETWVRPR